MNRKQPTAVEFDLATKVYPDGTRGLDDVSLKIPAGQFCILLGRSGAGKSTLLRMVNGLVEPSSGEVHVEGIRLDRKSRTRVRQKVAMIHQHFNLSPRMTVLNNVLSGALRDISTPAALLGLFPADLRRKACRLLAEVGLSEDHIYRRASQLSGGQQQRVGIARAFILHPPVVLADEPVASLDPSISRDILSLLRKTAREQNATVICSLHQVDLAREFADRIVGMQNGSVVYDGCPEDLSPDVLHDLYAAQEKGAESSGETPAKRTESGTDVPLFLRVK